VTTEREKMIEELEQLQPSSKARAILLRRDDAGLARAIEKMRADHRRVRETGRMEASGMGLRVVDRAV
jgi:hypothetical protein